MAPETSDASGAESKPAAQPDKSAAELPAPDVQIGSIHWYSDYDQGLAVARSLNRPIWLHFGENPG